MDYTEEQKAAFRAEFAVRRRRQLAASGALVAMILAIAFASERGAISPKLSIFLGNVLFLLGAVLVGFTLRNWRCPACGGYLGKGIGPRFCSKCGAPLR